MLMAMNEQKKLVMAPELELNNKGTHYCPGCQEPVFLKQGTHKVAHFSHYPGSDCQQFAEGETVEHVAGKLWLYKLLGRSFSKVELEPYLPKLQQRPDLLLPEQRLAVEFQCSSIPIDLVAERTAGYQKYNYRVIWIAGTPLMASKSLTALQKSLLFSHQAGPPKLLYLNMQASYVGMAVPYARQLFTTQLSTHTVKRFADWLQLSVPLRQQSELENRSIEYWHRQLEREAFYRNQSLLSFLQLLYEDRESLISIPRELYYPLASDWMIRTHDFEWRYRLLKWVESLPTYHVMTPKRIAKWLSKQVQAKHIAYYRLPTLDQSIKIAPLMEFLDELVCSGVLKKQGAIGYCRRGRAKRFSSLEEKFTATNQK
ncbi:competence protein CoiA family protein [Dolosigranulum savutiense]|uniref:Competence protein CoiA family protein n=1 Tax=Dolosigranulum savutiense TaxID=3110288 RepID=A0AB74U464_9LACT